MFIESSGTLTSLNNIFSDNSAEMGSAVYISNTVEGTIDYNLYFNNQDDGGQAETNFTIGSNSLATDPLFIDRSIISMRPHQRATAGRTAACYLSMGPIMKMIHARPAVGSILGRTSGWNGRRSL